MSLVILIQVLALYLFPFVNSQAGIPSGNGDTFSGNTGVGALNSATNMQPPPNVRPVGGGGAPNNPDMQAVQDPSRFQMAPFIGPEGASATLPRSRTQGEAMSGDPIPARRISDRQRITNYINEQKIAATLPKLCTVHPSMRHMKVMPMPMVLGNPPENRGQLGMTPPAGGPLLNRMQLVQPQFQTSNGVQRAMNMQQVQMQNIGRIMSPNMQQRPNSMVSHFGTQENLTPQKVPMPPVYAGNAQVHMKLPSSGTIVRVHV